MSDQAIIAIVAAVAPTIMAFAALMQGRANGARAAETNAKSDVIIEKTDGHLSKLTASLELANQKIEGLQKLVAALAKGKGDGG